MQPIVLLVYVAVLAISLTYAVGGLGLGSAIVIGLAVMVAIEVVIFRRDNRRRARTGPGHHRAAH